MSPLSLVRCHPRSTLFPYTTLFRSWRFVGIVPRSVNENCPLDSVKVCGFGEMRAFPVGQSFSQSCPSPGDGERPHLPRSEEHTSELQSLTNLVCRLLLGKKKKSSDT